MIKVTIKRYSKENSIKKSLFYFKRLNQTIRINENV